ncbi:PREDICTED: uncharacterized protein LOC108374953, partial [Rhagoletis zephyria]|uniref:uncharacterized protein LOC108374953 n=1 Tax=Rhagoletis zephyria TaxID=28612 RepID=UPI000811806E
RFAIDFNYDGSGWEILQLEWINDDDEKMRYNYKHQNRLWSEEGDASTSARSDGEAAEEPENNTNVHVSGEYQGDIYNVNYSNDNTLNAPSQTNIQATIGEVLDYIQTNVLPTLK